MRELQEEEAEGIFRAFFYSAPFTPAREWPANSIRSQCNGTRPCDNCSKRSVECLFVQPVPATTQRRVSQKRRDIPSPDWSQGMVSASTEGRDSTVYNTFPPSVSMGSSAQSQDGGTSGTGIHHSPSSQNRVSGDPFPAPNDVDGVQQNVGQSGSSETDEAEIQEASRMLNDGKGRMCRCPFQLSQRPEVEGWS